MGSPRVFTANRKSALVRALGTGKSRKCKATVLFYYTFSLNTSTTFYKQVWLAFVLCAIAGIAITTSPKTVSEVFTRRPQTSTRRPQTVTRRPQRLTRRSQRLTRYLQSITRCPQTFTRRPQRLTCDG